MGIEEYVHEIGQRLESCEDSAERVALARLLASTGSPDAQPFILDALAAEDDDDSRDAIRDALSALDEGD